MKYSVPGYDGTGDQVIPDLSRHRRRVTVVVGLKKWIGKSDISLEPILCIVKTENRVLLKQTEMLVDIFNEKLGFE